MKKSTLFILLWIVILLNPVVFYGQGQNTLSTEEIETYKKQVSDLVKYLEGTLNFLGDPQSVQKEKEIVINESYLKIFKNDKVQIEDDLDESREVPLHKDIQAYLKDIEFFFKSVSFEFVVADISHSISDDNQHYFIISFNRTLKGITITGDTVESKKARFMEVNLDVASNDLKIASIYTTKINEKEEIVNWWGNLPMTWKENFGSNIYIVDSIRLADVISFTDSLFLYVNNATVHDADTNRDYDIELPEERKTISNMGLEYDTMWMDTKMILTKLKGILKQQKVDISENKEIRKLDPLGELSDLRSVNFSNTLISDLSPLRNLNHIETINCSETPVDDMSQLLYASTLKELNCSYTLIKDLNPIAGLVLIEKLDCSGIRINSLDFLQNLSNLKYLDCGSTQIQDITPITDLENLEKLSISGTKIISLSPVENLSKLQYLNCEESSVTSLGPLKNLDSLEVLRISNTELTNLKSLSELTNLKKVYCDNTDISKEEAIQFMRDHPGCLVIFESEELLNGWEQLEQPWKDIIMELTGIPESPTKEELHSVLQIEELDIASKEGITYLNPIKRLYNLKSLNASNIVVDDYTPIEGAIELEKLNLSGSSIKDLEFVSDLKQLQELNIENTIISNLETLNGLSGLNLIYADGSKIDDRTAFNLRKENPNCLVIYKTEEMNEWWQNLGSEWKDFFSGQFKVDSPPTKLQLHKILFLDSLSIINHLQIKDLKPVSIMQGLKTLEFSGTQVSSLNSIVLLRGLQSIICTQNPIDDLTPLAGLSELEILNLENTPVSDLKPIVELTSIKKFNCSGTQVKSLKSIAGFTSLEEIELNNTSIKSLDPLQNLPNLKTVKCYNTKIKAKSVDKFKESKPDCEVVFY